MFGLGDLETAVMNVVWRSDEAARVRDVLQRLDTDRTHAYTTIMTVLDNLHRKGWVRREQVGRAYRYVPALSHEEAAVRALRDVLDSTEDPRATLLHFTESASDEELAVLRAALARRKSRQA